MEIISAKEVSFSYDKLNKVLKNVNLTINEGEYVAIIGHNGSGKSTLAKLFNGLLSADSGEITVGGLSVKDKANLIEIRKQVGVVFQNPDNQLIASIVEDDVAFGPENLGINRAEIGERIDYALSAVGMQKFRHSSPERLSGGQKQRIAIAGVLAIKPKVLVLDESTSMLDPEGRKEILAVVKELNQKEKTTIITITHYMDEVLSADRVIVINKGEIVMQGAPKEIFADVDKIKSYGLELPLSAYLADRIKKEGVSLNGVIMDELGLLEALCELK